jgi:hypothetical protein
LFDLEVICNFHNRLKFNRESPSTSAAAGAGVRRGFTLGR